MPFYVGESVNNVAAGFTNSTVVVSVLKNPFYTSLLIVVIIVLIILFVFRNVDFSGEDESLSKLVFRSSIYMLLIVTAIQFLNNQVWLQESKNKAGGEALKEVFGGVEKHNLHNLQNSSKVTPVMPKGAGVINFNIGPSTTDTSDIARVSEPINSQDITQ